MPILLESPPDRQTGDSTPPRNRKRRGGSGGKPQKYIYVCSENVSSIAEVSDILERARSDIRTRVQLLTYTDPEEFQSHAQRTLITRVHSVVAMCIRLTPDTVDAYFAVMCSLLTQLLPKFDPKNDPVDVRIALCSLYTFGKTDDTFALSEKNRDAWHDFLDIRSGDGESAWDILERFQKPLLWIDDESTLSWMRSMLALRLGE